MIANSKRNNRPCIFVTDDRKADWWLSDKSKNFYMPLPELRKEFKTLSNNLFYSYQPFNFLELVKSEFEIEIDPEVIREVKELLYISNDNELAEMFVIRQRKSGDIDNLETALVQLGYQINIVQSKHNEYNIFAFFPMIPDIRRIFVQKLKELAEYYELEILGDNIP